jgi:SIR2-like domain
VPEADDAVATIFRRLVAGWVVPFLGAGASLGRRPVDAGLELGSYVPSAGELADYLAAMFRYEGRDDGNLLAVAEYIEIMHGRAPLYEALRRVFAADYQPTALHRFFARFPGLLREKELRPNYLLLLTTNFDDLLERAFEEVEEPFDLIWYVADGEERGRFLHRPADASTPRLIDEPWRYADVSLAERTVILKLHGSVHREDQEFDSFAITQEHYIEYLTTDVWNMFPPALAAEMQSRSYLFLGYSLADWNLIVTLRRMGAMQTATSWAIQLDPNEVPRRRWDRRGVTVLGMDVEDLAARLTEAAEALVPPGH